MTKIPFTKTVAAFALALSLAAAPTAFAQTSTMTPAPQHQSIFHKMFGKKQPASTMQHGTMGMTSHAGSIIGNKNTHVYHVAGDHSTLPAMKNRVYFTSVSQAMAAGYHASGSSHSTMKAHTMSHSMHSTSTMAH